MNPALSIRSISFFSVYVLSVLLGMVIEKMVLHPPLVQFGESSLLPFRRADITFSEISTVSWWICVCRSSICRMFWWFRPMVISCVLLVASTCRSVGYLLQGTSRSLILVFPVCQRRGYAGNGYRRLSVLSSFSGSLLYQFGFWCGYSIGHVLAYWPRRLWKVCTPYLQWLLVLYFRNEIC